MVLFNPSAQLAVEVISFHSQLPAVEFIDLASYHNYVEELLHRHNRLCRLRSIFGCKLTFGRGDTLK